MDRVIAPPKKQPTTDPTDRYTADLQCSLGHWVSKALEEEQLGLGRSSPVGSSLGVFKNMMGMLEVMFTYDTS